MLRRQHELGGQLGQKEVRASVGRLLRVLASQERGRWNPSGDGRRKWYFS